MFSSQCLKNPFSSSYNRDPMRGFSAQMGHATGINNIFDSDLLYLYFATILHNALKFRSLYSESLLLLYLTKALSRATILHAMRCRTNNFH